MFKQLRARAIAPIAVLLMLSASAVGAVSANLFAPVRPVTEMSVVDAQGRLVGSVVSIAALHTRIDRETIAAPVVVVRVGGLPITLAVSSTQLLASNLIPAGGLDMGGNTFNVDAFFESTDCTGQAFIDLHAEPTALLPLVAMVGARLYVPTTPIQNVTGRSVLSAQADGTLACNAAAAELAAAPATQIADLATEFQAPFRLRFGDRD